MVRHLARHEARASVDHRRIADARVLAKMESAHDRASNSPREESRMSNSELPSRNEVEDLLYREAALLDEWRLEEWLELLTDDASYQGPPTDVPGGDSLHTLFIISDDTVRSCLSVQQLLRKSALGENTHSPTRLMITNIR